MSDVHPRVFDVTFDAYCDSGTGRTPKEQQEWLRDTIQNVKDVVAVAAKPPGAHRFYWPPVCKLYADRRMSVALQPIPHEVERMTVAQIRELAAPVIDKTLAE